MALDIEYSIGAAFADIQAVEQVYVRRQGDLCDVTTVIDNEDEDAYDLIYDHERNLIRSHRDLRFNFHVIARRGRPLEEIAGRNQPIWHRSDAANLCLNATNI